MLRLAAGGRGRKWTGIENGKEASSVSFISFWLYSFCIFGMSIYQHSTVLKNLFCVGTSWHLFYFNSKKAAYVISIQLTVSKPYTFGLSHLLDLVIR